MKSFRIDKSGKQLQRISAVLLVALILTGFFAYNTYDEKRQYQTFLQNSYQSSFREMITNVESLKVLLDKAEVTASTTNSNFLMTQIWQQSASASDNLGRLPISHSALSKTQKFLNQVGDFCYSISKKNAANELMDDEQLDKISKMNDYSKSLLSQLLELQNEVEKGSLSFGELRKKGKLAFKKVSTNDVDMKFGKVEEGFVEYPTLIYDGPFSDNIVEGKPKGLTGDKVSLEKAKEIAKKFVGENEIKEVKFISSGRGIIETYGLELIPMDNKNNESINIDVTKKGGHVLWMLNPRNVSEKKLTVKQASEKAKEFLKKAGFENLKETYYLLNENTVMIVFIVEKDGVLIYPDLMKVKVALDNGQIVGFDSYQYLMAKKDREELKAKISEEEANKNVTQRINVERVKLALIPMPGNKEYLCYEFKGKYKDNDYFIYINAESGKEERILKIIKTENGTLTQ